MVGDGGEVPADFNFDTGAKVNMVSQRFVVERDMQPLDEADLPRPTWMDGKGVYCYGAFQALYRLKDSQGYKKECEHIFYTINKEGPAFVLGIPALKKEDIKIEAAIGKQRFGVAEGAFELIEPNDFAGVLEKEPIVYALIYTSTSQDEDAELRIGGVEAPAEHSSGDVTIPKLPLELREFKDVFSTQEVGRLAPYEGYDYTIETIGEPPYRPLYNLSNTKLAVLRNYLDDALAKGWIRYSTSPASAPILFVPKKDGGLRLYVDYRGLNKVIVKNRHPLLLISETLDRLSGAKVFIKLDLKDAYHRVRIKEGDEWKTTFRTRYSYFEYIVILFRLTNTLVTFQAYINKSLVGLLNDFCVVYLDDILIFSKTYKEYIGHVRKVLERLRRFRLFANLKKCEFFIKEVEFLGFIISTKGVTIDLRRIDTIRTWPKLKTYYKVQIFLGFVNFYRRFIHYYSQIAGLLTGLLKGS